MNSFLILVVRNVFSLPTDPEMIDSQKKTDGENRLLDFNCPLIYLIAGGADRLRDLVILRAVGTDSNFILKSFPATSTN